MFNQNLHDNIRAMQQKQQEKENWMDEIKELLITISEDLKKISEGK